jgi:hypothetical protein
MIFEMLELSWDIFFNIWIYMTHGKMKKDPDLPRRKITD